MKALIWRELRALRHAALVVGTLVVVLAVAFAGTLLGESPDKEATGKRLYLLFAGWTVLVPAIALSLGCRAFARERARREVEFSASWPVSRGQVWLAKTAVGLGALVALAGAGWLCVWAAAPLLAGLEAAEVVTLGAPFILHAVLISAGAVALFALGLLMSTIRPSPFDALGSSLLAALLQRLADLASAHLAGQGDRARADVGGASRPGLRRMHRAAGATRPRCGR
ncbi:MAG: ABC transporter permease subunit [Armatimonadota bacterium]